jgi:hypothetical protein
VSAVLVQPVAGTRAIAGTPCPATLCGVAPSVAYLPTDDLTGRSAGTESPIVGFTVTDVVFVGAADGVNDQVNEATWPTKF